MFLDSGTVQARWGRYDIIVSDPLVKLITRGDMTQIITTDGEQQSSADPFSILRQSLSEMSFESSDLPFSGGALGYFGYDLGRQIETIPALAEDDEQLPTMAMGIYDWALVVDHQAQQTYLVGQDSGRLNAQKWASLIDQFSQPYKPLATHDFQVTAAIEASLSADQYATAYQKIKEYIVEGDCYQVNLAQRFSTQCSGDPWLAYCALRKINAAPFGAYLNLPQMQILSCSPERFIQLRGNDAETQPIKGTRPRSNDEVKDELQKTALRNSAKDQAENVMIVDLLRNDFGKSCKPGSIDASELFKVESFATVHHLVSTVRGQLEEGVDSIDLLRGCFPGGSITGAPKLRAMEIIEELEPHRRGVYCGSIGYLGFDGDMDTNIAIRTLTHQNGKLHFWAGGGIVHDSTLEGEYQECFDKAAAMLTLFQAE